MEDIFQILMVMGVEVSEISTKVTKKTTDLSTVASKIAELLLKGKQNNLPAVMIKGKGSGFYYSISDKKYVLVPKQGEMYLLPYKQDEKERFYVFTNGIFHSGVIILVPHNEIVLIGFQ